MRHSRGVARLPTLSRSALLPYAPEAVYQVVCDVSRYAEFLPWCSSSVVVEENERNVTASLEFGVGGLRERVTTRNTLIPSERIELSLVSGPFSHFAGVWRFTALGDAGCKVSFDVDYRLTGTRALLRRAFVGQAADKLVDAFARRCAELLD